MVQGKVVLTLSLFEGLASKIVLLTSSLLVGTLENPTLSSLVNDNLHPLCEEGAVLETLADRQHSRPLLAPVKTHPLATADFPRLAG